MTPFRLLQTGCAAVYLVAGILILVGTRPRRTGVLLAAGCLGTAFWAAAEAAMPRTVPAIALDMLRGLVWYCFALHCFRRATEGREAGGLFTLLGLVLVAASAGTLGLLRGDTLALGARLVAPLAIGIGVATMLLLENLYRNTPEDRRWHVNLACIALGLFSAYDIALAANTELTGRLSLIMLEGRPVVVALLAPLLVVTGWRNRSWSTAIHVSRAVALHSATLILSGIFLLSLVVAGETLRALHAGWGSVAEISLVFAGLGVLGMFATTASIRSRLRALVIDHFFVHRFDYRAEWSKCLKVLSVSGVYSALHARVIRAVAEVVDSPGGILLLREPGESVFHWAGSLNLPAGTVPLPPEHPLIGRLEAGDAIETGDLREDGYPEVWLAVPLQQEEAMLGLVLLAPPRAAFRLDAEVFELLRIVGRSAASHVAEQQASQMLLQARQLQEYGKRFAFVAHDIKNVAGQLAMLLSNAEAHMQDPEFQRDVLVTVGASVQRIGALLKRLEAQPDTARHMLEPVARLEALVAAMRCLGPVPITLEHDRLRGAVAMDPAAFDTAVTHLLTNAIEASTPAAEVVVRVRHGARRVTVEIVDHGSGMTESFIGTRLFTPFATSKRGGSGIGAFQARELLRTAGGDLRAISEVGKGTMMQLVLPLAERAIPQPLPLTA